VDRQQTRLRQQMEGTRRRVQQLLEQHDLVESRRINTRNYAVSYATDMAHRFFELFGRGFDPVNHPIQSRQAEAFLRGVMRDDALCTEFRGVDMFLKQYQVGTAIHESMALSLHRLVLLNTGDDSIQIKTEATASFRISRTTLETLFPSIIQDEPLAQQLIGREYKMQYDKVFHFADGRIYQHESRIDLCSGLLQLVGDPFLALKLFEASVLTKHGHWRIEEVAEDAHELPNALL
jgi:ketosteroid isomerase-like protein